MNVVIFIILITLFAIFTKTFKNLRVSLDSKYYEVTDFHELLNSFINTNKATNTETIDGKNRILNYAKPLYNKYLDTYKKIW